MKRLTNRVLNNCAKAQYLLSCFSHAARYKPTIKENIMKKLGMVLLSLAAFGASAAENLQLDLNLYLNNQLVKTHAVKTEEDKIQTVTADGILKFDVTPSLHNQIVTLTSTLYKFENGSYNKFQEPKLMVNLNEPATIEVGTEGVEVYRIEITASKI